MWGALAAWWLTLGTSSARAQTGESWALGGGLRLVGAMPFGRVDAVETGSSGQPVTLFTTESELSASAGWHMLAAKRLGQDWQVEATIARQRVELVTQVNNDVEDAAPSRASEPISHWQLEGGVRWTPARGRLTSSLALFATAGAGYVRQLHSGRTLVESGRSIYVGAGAERALWRGHRNVLAGRLEGRAVWLAKGVAFDDRYRVAPALVATAVWSR